MLSDLIDASGWSHEQWLAASILAFIAITLCVVMARVLKLVRMLRKTVYRPNLRPLRRHRSE